MHQGLSGHLDQILPLHQREQTPSGGGGNGISQRQVLQHQGITGLEGRAAEGRSGEEAGEAIGGTAKNPTPTDRPQRRDKDARPRRAPGLILGAA